MIGVKKVAYFSTKQRIRTEPVGKDRVNQTHLGLSEENHAVLD